MDGRGLPVDGVKAEGHARWTHHITLEGLVIRGHNNNQQTVAISTKCPSWNWVIRGNIIDGAGTGIYLGNSNGRDAFVGGLIEHNLIKNTLGYNLQVKHQKQREEVAGMPSGREDTIIRHNVFSKAAGGGQLEMARPNVLVGHWPLSGGGQEDRYLIYGNFFYQNPHEALFQGEGNVALYSNLFVNDFGDAIHIQPHNDVPRQVAVFQNTVVAAGEGVAIRKPQGDVPQSIPSYPQEVVANAVFAKSPILADQQRVNITGRFAEANKYLWNPKARLGVMDLRPRANLATDSDTALPQSYPDGDRDFDGKQRQPGEAGAYSAGTSVGYWTPRLEVKPGYRSQ